MSFTASSAAAGSAATRCHMKNRVHFFSEPRRCVLRNVYKRYQSDGWSAIHFFGDAQ
jgi:hypothetical protein